MSLASSAERVASRSELATASIVIPAYLSHETIAATLEALIAEVSGLEAEIIVVDSSPDERTATEVRRFEGIELIRSQRRLLPHGARNRGAAAAEGECLVFTDPDCIPEPGWLRALLEAHAEAAEIVGGPIGNTGGGVLVRAIHLTKFSAWLPGASAGKRPHLPTANLLVGRRAWDRFGPFDPRRWSSDTRFCERAIAAGTPAMFVPRAAVGHTHEAELRPFLRERRIRGRDFARMRAETDGWSRRRCRARGALAPLVPLLLLTRSLRACAEAGALARSLPTIPLQLVGFVAWALGEAQGYLDDPQAGARPRPPRAHPIVGHLVRWRRAPLELLASCRSDPAPATRLRIVRPTYVLKDPDDIRDVLVTRPQLFPKSLRVSGARGRRLAAESMINQPSVTTEDHRIGREAVAPFLARPAAGRYLERIDRQVTSVIDGWTAGETIDAEAEMTTIATTAMLSGVFGLDGGPKGDALLAALRERRASFARSVTSLLPIPELPFRTPGPDPLEATVRGLLAAAIERDTDEGASVLDHLARDCRRDRTDRGIAVNQLTGLAITGFQTIAAGLTWTLHELLHSPALRDRLEGEITPGRASAGAAADHGLARMTIDEALRLHPPSWLFTRVASERTTLPSGVRVERRAKLFISPWLVHRLPELWDDPLRFDVDRFVPGIGASRPRFAYLPFGGGPRICVGRAFALNEMALVLVRIVESKRLRARSGAVSYRSDLTLLPDQPILAEVERRG